MKRHNNYVNDNKVTEKYMAQMQIQMFVTNLNSFFYVVDCNFEVTNNVKKLLVNYDETFWIKG